MDPSVLLLADRGMLAHRPGEDHPEHPRRLRAVRDPLEARPVPGAAWVGSRPGSRAAAERVHTAAYLDRLEALSGRSARLDPDTAVSPGSLEAAWLALGCALEATARVVGGPVSRAFALVRPPGHHAEADRAMGFCLINNVAVAAAHAVAALGCARVLVVDWDVHHGNGTQHAFYRRHDVLVFNIHRFPYYPGTGALGETGAGPGEGFTVNAPLPPGLGDAAYGLIFRELLAPVARSFAPDLVLVSAGFDAHADDPLADMSVSTAGFAALCGVVRDLADQLCGGRLVLVLEGGYDLKALGESVRACVEVLAGGASPGFPAPSERDLDLLRALLTHHRARWPLGPEPHRIEDPRGP